MSKKNKSLCFGTLVEKIKKIDLTMENLEVTIRDLKVSMGEMPDDEEVCPDELESEKVLLEMLQVACLEGMLGEEPEGEA